MLKVRIATIEPMANADRLTGLDASFLALEKRGAHMHVGSVLVFAGPAPEYDDFLARIESRLHLVPRYRQRLAPPPFRLPRPPLGDDTPFHPPHPLPHTPPPEPPGGE